MTGATGRTADHADTAARGPIFLVGSMRSGSTLLRLILDSHPHIAIGAETGFMGALRGTKEIPTWRYGKGWYERLNWTEAELDDRLREFYGGMFGRYCAERGKQRWGEKTPFHTSHMREMAQVFPDAVFVGIVRHPGAVATSLRRNFHYTFGDAVAYWLSTNLDLLRAGSRLGPRFLLCRYEDLVRESAAVLGEILAFLDEPWSPDVLAHDRVQRAQGTPRVVDGSTLSREPIDPGRTDRWVRSITEEDRCVLDAVSGVGGFLGYRPLETEAQAWLRQLPAGPRWTVTGDDLGRRSGEWDDLVASDRRQPQQVIDASPQELAERLDRAERALARVRSRRSVRLADALRRVQRGRSLDDVRVAWSLVRGTASGQGS